MELWHFEFLEGGPKRPKIGENWQTLAKIGPLDPSFYFISPPPTTHLFVLIFSGTALVANKAPEKI